MSRGLLPFVPSPHPLGETLPALFQEDAFVQELCAGLDAVLSPVVSTLDCLTAYLDPDTAPEDLLEWLAGWVGITFDGARTPERRRALVRAGAEVHRWRGTARGIREAIEAVYDVTPEVRENGASGWSAHAGAPLPGAVTPQLVVRLQAPATMYIDERELDAVVAAVKPAHMPHKVVVVALTSS